MATLPKTATAPKPGSLEWQCSPAGKKARMETDSIKQLKAENAELKRKIRLAKLQKGRV